MAEGQNHTTLYIIGIAILLILIPASGVMGAVPLAMLPFFRAENPTYQEPGGLSGGGCYGATSGQTGSATKEGHSLPATEGKVGREQHLALKGPNDSPTDFVQSSTDKNHPAALVHHQLSGTPQSAQNGMAGRYGARGKASTVEEERYYVNMRWDYSGPGGRDWWFEPPQTILVTNPKNGKQVRAALIEYGPATWTKRVSGLSPEAMDVLAVDTDATLLYAFASPCRATTGGTTTPGTGQMKGRGITARPSPGITALVVQEGRRLQYKDLGTINPSMVVLHYTVEENFSKTIAVLEERGLSVHIVIDKDGTAYQIMDSLNEKSAGASGANDWAINIEIVARNTSELNDAQLNSTVRVVEQLANRFSIQRIISTNSTNPDANTLSSLRNHQGVFSHQIVDKYLNDGRNGKIDPGDSFMNRVKNGLGW